VTGGCIVHIIDSLAEHGVRCVPVAHEQAGAMAADGYARIKGLGVALTTSGPGATNLLTGCCCSYYDSVPVLFLTGQVPRNQLKGASGSRQIGFQETDVVSIFKPVTKHAKLVTDPLMIRHELERALYIATSGRPGPVLLDICDDVQRAEIDPENLVGFFPPTEFVPPLPSLDWVAGMVSTAARPLMIIGTGARHAPVLDLIERYGIPFTLTWGAYDLIDHDHPLFAGGFGVTSGRPGNFAVQNADLLLAIGTRLDSHETASYKTFARKATKIIVDIDQAEQAKYTAMGMDRVHLITADAKAVVDELLFTKAATPSIGPWKQRIRHWRKRYPIEADHAQRQAVNPYVFMQELAKQAPESIIVSDCGSNLIWTMQGIEVKGHRIISSFNHSPMGYALPASIGVALATGRQVICITGDGGLQMNIQELATIQKLSPNIRIFVLNNHGYGIIKGTQDAWLSGRHHASGTKDLPDPDFINIARAYGLVTYSINNHSELHRISIVLGTDVPTLCVVDMLPIPQIAPKLMAGRPLEDAHPLLSREELMQNMASGEEERSWQNALE
jgi:acetolactate synthase-1/2/3 large subunit